MQIRAPWQKYLYQPFRIKRKFAWVLIKLEDDSLIWLERYYSLEKWGEYPEGYSTQHPKLNIGAAPRIVTGWYEHTNTKTLDELKAWVRQDRQDRKSTRERLLKLMSGEGINLDDWESE